MKKLTQDQYDTYMETGAVAPVRVMSKERAAGLLARLEEGERHHGAAFRQILRTKAHLTLKWVDDLVRAPEILDAVEDLIGPDLLLYNMSVFIKDAHDPSFVGWHQDCTYFPQDDPVLVNAWLALTDSVKENGNVRYAAGSHKLGQLKHERGLEGTLLSQGQSIQGMQFDDVRDMYLQPGEMSLHNTRTVHYSEPNTSNRRRIGISMSYIPTSARDTSSIRHSAMLVRGTDRYGYYDHEPRISMDFDPAVQAFKEQAIRNFRASNQEIARRHEAEFS